MTKLLRGKSNSAHRAACGASCRSRQAAGRSSILHAGETLRIQPEKLGKDHARCAQTARFVGKPDRDSWIICLLSPLPSLLPAYRFEVNLPFLFVFRLEMPEEEPSNQSQSSEVNFVFLRSRRDEIHSVRSKLWK